MVKDKKNNNLTEFEPKKSYPRPPAIPLGQTPSLQIMGLKCR